MTHDKKNAVIVIPSELPGGFDAVPSCHFGQSPVFNVISYSNGSSSLNGIISNPYTLCKNCFLPIGLLIKNKADVLITNIIGAMPLRILEDSGIEVLHFEGCISVNEVLDRYASSYLEKFDFSKVCSGECES